MCIALVSLEGENKKSTVQQKAKEGIDMMKNIINRNKILQYQI